MVAKRYANALFGYAKEHNVVEKVLDELKSLAELYNSSDEFRELLKNPLIKVEEKEKVFEKMYEEKAIDKVLYNFLLILTEKRRLPLLLEIYTYYRVLLMEERGEVDALVKVADEYDEGILRQIGDSLSKATGKKVNLNVTVDKNILGGFIAQVKSNLYDVSIKGQLDKLKETLLKV